MKNLTLKFAARVATFFALGCLWGATRAAAAQGFTPVNLVSDIAGVARRADPNLVNAWGIVFPPSGNLWIAANGTGLSTVYRPDGTVVPLVVTIPPPAGSPADTVATPTGVALNDTTDFVISNSTAAAAKFIFATENGTIAGWAPSVASTNAILAVDNSAAGAVYKSVALAATGGSNYLYVANFNAGVVEMYDTHFQFVRSFTDVTVPAGYAPFGIGVINGNLYVTFALQQPSKHDDQAGPGNGCVSVFTPAGTFVKQLIAQGKLNSPWGLAVAPKGFGKLGGALLVGNFGDGTINAYNLTTGAWLSHLSFANGDPIVINGLWGLTFGTKLATASKGEDKDRSRVLYFTAGIADESHGLFGFIRPALGGDFR